jgi:hypothetical protein
MHYLKFIQDKKKFGKRIPKFKTRGKNKNLGGEKESLGVGKRKFLIRKPRGQTQTFIKWQQHLYLCVQISSDFDRKIQID